jgi:ABC-type multidrug transport system fused ATPase/permease subunit
MMRKGGGGGRMRGHKHPKRKITKEELKTLSKADFAFMKPFLHKHRKKIISSICWTLITALSVIFPPLVFKTIIDDLIPRKDYTGILQYTIGLAIFYVFFFLANCKKSRVTTITAQVVLKDVRESIFQRLLALSFDYYEEKKRGELISVVINDVETLSNAITTGLINLFSDIISLIAIMIAMVSLDWQLGLFTYLFIPSILLVVKKFGKRIKKSHLKIRKKVAQMNANVEENVSGIRVAQSLAVEKRNIRGFRTLSKENYALRMKATTLAAKMNAVMSFITFMGIAILIGIGGVRYTIGGITLGILIAFLEYSTQFLRPLWNLTNISNTFLEAGASLMHIRDYMNVEPSVKSPKDSIAEIDNTKGEIELKNVDFSYTKEPFMTNLNLKIGNNERIGIVGETGAGKSTLINLMTRLYDVKGGEILVNGQNIKSYSIQDFRSLVAIVSQNVFLFSDTILNNIRFGDPDASDEEVIEAAKIAQVHQFIEKMPEKYNTKLGEQGTGLSGGQKQLIAYARLILAKPKIAILDEATSNIDSYTENIIQENMKKLLTNCTLIVIAHRFATLQAVNRLILVNDGKIADSGSHSELMERNDYYHELYTQQYSKI